MLTYQRHSIPSITRCSFDACRFLTVLTLSCSAGSRHTCMAAHSTFAAVILLACHNFCRVVFHKDQSLNQSFCLLYMADLMKLVMKSRLRLHLYVDSLQIYGFCAPTATQALLDQVAACISVVWSWMRSNWLQLNADKTESLWCTRARQQQLISSSPLLYALTTSYHWSTFVIWAFTSTAICQWKPTYRELCPAASLLYVRLRAYSVPSVSQFCCSWYRHWSYRDLIMEASCYMASQDISWTIYSQCSTLQRDWSTAFASTTALLCCSRNFNGCKSPSESSFDWPFSCLSVAKDSTSEPGRWFAVGRGWRLKNATEVDHVEQTDCASVSSINGGRPRLRRHCTTPLEQSDDKCNLS